MFRVHQGKMGDTAVIPVQNDEVVSFHQPSGLGTQKGSALWDDYGAQGEVNARSRCAAILV